MISRFLRDQAWWRLDCAGASALRIARSVVSLLDAAAYVAQVPDEHPDLRSLALAGCFHGAVVDPGVAGRLSDNPGLLLPGRYRPGLGVTRQAIQKMLAV